MPTRPKLIAGNWKMYTLLAEAKALAAAVSAGVGDDIRAKVAVCPPFPWLTAVADVIRNTRVSLCGQNCHYEREGAFTGEVSPAMLLDAGCEYVIIGHSERRHGLYEPDPLLNRKAKAALAAGLRVIFCVGELLAEREAGQTEAILDTQLAGGLAGIPDDHLSRLSIAYEPVWAIGTGKVATPAQAQEAHAFIRQTFAKLYGEKPAGSLLILYGGSVKPDNAAGLLNLPDVDGAMVGGASLKANDFLAIARAVR